MEGHYGTGEAPAETRSGESPVSRRSHASKRYSGFEAEIEVELPEFQARVSASPDFPGSDPASPGPLESLESNPGIPENRIWAGGPSPGIDMGNPVLLHTGVPQPMSSVVESSSLVPKGLEWDRKPPRPEDLRRFASAGDPLARFPGGGEDEDAPDLGRRGLSAGAVFGVAVFSQLIVLGLAAAMIWAFPRETGELIRRLANRLDLVDRGHFLVGAPGENGAGSRLDRLAVLKLEDRALYRAERAALERLQRLGRELGPEDEEFDAVQASLIRVRQSYQLSLGEVPAPLDPREILPEVETEKDLTVRALVDVLRNRRQSPVKRQRAAYLLANERQSDVAKSALFHAIQDDPNLFVVRQAFHSFQELTSYPGRDFFDADAIDRWWARNSASLMGQTATK